MGSRVAKVTQVCWRICDLQLNLIKVEEIASFLYICREMEQLQDVLVRKNKIHFKKPWNQKHSWTNNCESNWLLYGLKNFSHLIQKVKCFGKTSQFEKPLTI